MGNGHIEAVRQYALTPGKATAPEEAKAFIITSVCDTRRLGAGPGVAGSVAESRESGGRLQSRFGGPEAKKGRWKTLDLSATLINSWPSSVEGFFSCLVYP